MHPDERFGETLARTRASWYRIRPSPSLLSAFGLRFQGLGVTRWRMYYVWLLGVKSIHPAWHNML